MTTGTDLKTAREIADRWLRCSGLGTASTILQHIETLAHLILGVEAQCIPRVDAAKVRDEAITLLTQAGGIIVEFANLNGFRNLSDAELGRSVHEMAKAIADFLNEHAPLSAEQISVVKRHRAIKSTSAGEGEDD